MLVSRGVVQLLDASLNDQGEHYWNPIVDDWSQHFRLLATVSCRQILCAQQLSSILLTTNHLPTHCAESKYRDVQGELSPFTHLHIYEFASCMAKKQF